MAHSVAALDLEVDEGVLRREWRFERFGWGVIAFVLLAGFAGLFGDGPLASVSVASADGGALVRYDRIVRHGTPTEITLHLAPAGGVDTIVVVSLDEKYLGDIDVRDVSPSPLGVRASSGRVEYRLLRLSPTEPMTVVFSVQPGAAGVRRALLGTSHGTLQLPQLVLP